MPTNITIGSFMTQVEIIEQLSALILDKTIQPDTKTEQAKPLIHELKKAHESSANAKDAPFCPIEADGMPILCRAVSAKQPEIVRLLLEANVDPDAKTIRGSGKYREEFYAVHYAILVGCTRSFNLLREYECDLPNFGYNKTTTPLMIAVKPRYCQSDRNDIIQILIKKAGMDVNAVSEGDSVLDLAHMHAEDDYGLILISDLINLGAQYAYDGAVRADELFSKIQKVKFKGPKAVTCLKKCCELFEKEIKGLDKDDSVALEKMNDKLNEVRKYLADMQKTPKSPSFFSSEPEEKSKPASESKGPYMRMK